ncbi:TPA: Holliday junction branch migration DNA helicase RuvB [Candidatus Peregrinibacteria bacterium]|nr:Holliday junction branch migration DNA helicase RuvB [Candidatus Peregrinibacteria bacterium]
MTLVSKKNQQTDERVIASATEKGDIIEVTLRPKKMSEYIGQTDVKKNLSVFMEAAKKRREPLEHVLIHGSPGLGKTTLANILAHEMGVNIKTTSGPALEKQGDLAAILTNLRENDILFIDEIHRLKSPIEEILYSAMEDFCLDLVIGKGPAARSMRLKLPKFTLIGATTKLSMISSPLRDRFGNIIKLEFYKEEEIRDVILRSAQILHLSIENDAAIRLSKSSRQTPRIANRLLKRVRDFATVYENTDAINISTVEKALSSLGVDELGLDNTDRDILITIAEKFNGGPVGLNTIAAATNEEQNTVEDIYEPYLLQLGFMERTPRGRMITDRARKHLRLPEAKNQLLF